MFINIYKAVAEKLGYPESTCLQRILEKTLTLEEAQIVNELPSSAAQISEKLKIERDTINKKLLEIYKKGVLDSTSKGYFLVRDVVNMHDQSIANPDLDPAVDPELFDLWKNFFKNEGSVGRANFYLKQNSPVHRVVPAWKSIQNCPNVLPHEDVREILLQQKWIALAHCACRRSARNCEKPTEVCLWVDKKAQDWIMRGIARRVTHEEAMEVIDAAEDAGLVHHVGNKVIWYSLSFALCSCCSDCCLAWAPVIQNGVPLEKAWAKSRYEAQVDPDLCTGCRICFKRCQFGAIELQKVPGTKKRYKAYVDPEKCWGCGVCTLSCEPQAITMKEVRPPEYIPE